MPARLRSFDVAVFVLALAAAGQQPQSSGTASIAGRVVEAGTQHGVGVATVIVDGSNDGAQRFVLTDDDGSFVLENLPAGSHTVSATKPDWLPGEFGRTHPTGPYGRITLTSGERRSGVVIAMWRTATITGSVRDERNEPLRGAIVQLFLHSLTAGMPRLLPRGSVTTDERGAYHISGIEPGKYAVGLFIPYRTALASKSANLAYRPLFFPSAPLAPQALIMSLGSGEERPGVDFTAEAIPVVSVSGAVTGSSVVPLDTSITLTPVELDSASERTLQLSAVPDTEGRFAFTHVSAGDYVLRVVTHKYPPVDARVPASTNLWAELPVSVSDQPVANLTLALRPGSEVTGLIELKGTKEVPADSLAGISLLLLPWDEMSSEFMPGGRADPRGRFTITGVVPGRYVLYVLHGPGKALRLGDPDESAPSAWTFASALYRGVDISDEPIEITGDISDVMITFTDHPARITGRVTNPGVADSDAVVAVFPVDEHAWIGHGADPRRVTYAHTTPDGRYSFVGLPPGAYYLAAISVGSIEQLLDPDLLRRLAAVANRIDIRENENKNQDLNTVRIR